MEKSETTKFVAKPSFDLESTIIKIAVDFANNFPVKLEAIVKDLESGLKKWEQKRNLSANTLFIMNTDQRHKEISEIMNILEESFKQVFTNPKVLDKALDIAQKDLEHNLLSKL